MPMWIDPQAPDSAKLAQLRGWIEDGLSYREMGERTGQTRECVRRICKLLGLIERDRQRHAPGHPSAENFASH